MRQRLISAAVLVPVVVIPFVLGDPWLTLGIAVLAAVAAYETSRLVTAAGLKADAWFAVGGTVVAVVGIRVGNGDFFFPAQYAVPADVLTFIALVVIGAACVGIRQRDPHAGLLVWVGNSFATLYASLLAFAAAILTMEGALIHVSLDSGRTWLMILVLTVWTLDSAAYVSGRYFPRGHFMNHISPNKTWSGAIGGTITAIVVCTALVAAAGQPPLFGVALGGLIAVAAQAGDLAESMLKRAARVKDSGSLIPGHGGILDRVDSFLLSAPAMFLALAWWQGFLRP